MDTFIPILGLMIPITALLIPIIAILAAHQRRMAEIAHRSGGPGNQNDARVLYELECLRRELSDVRNLVIQQSIAIDNIKPQLPAGSAAGERLEKVGL